jgi:hypothetical protein
MATIKEEAEKWAVVYTAAGNFIGAITDESENKITLEPAFNWINETVHMGDGRIGIVRQAMPLQSSLSSSKIEVQHVGIQRIKDWPEKDQMEILNVVNKTMGGMLETSAAKSGLVLPTAQTPKIKL